jgi:transposase
MVVKNPRICPSFLKTEPIVERTFAWLGQARRLSRDHERLPATSEAMIAR